MYFGENEGNGIPFYLNGVIAGWVCTTINGMYSHVLARHNVRSDANFKSELKCKLDLMRIFGE